MLDTLMPLVLLVLRDKLDLIAEFQHSYHQTLVREISLSWSYCLQLLCFGMAALNPSETHQMHSINDSEALGNWFGATQAEC